MRTPWFHKGLARPIRTAAMVKETTTQVEPSAGDDEHDDPSPKTPKFFNAFEFISSMSSGFDLSSLFEKKRKVGSIFTSRCRAAAILAKIEAVAKGLSMRVAKAKDFKLKMEAPTEGRKGRLAITAEIFEVAPEVAIVEFSKSSGDTLEYSKFFEDDVRPALKDIVWTWQGDCMCNGKDMMMAVENVNGMVCSHD